MRRTPTACPLDCPDTCGALAEVSDEGRFVRLSGNPAHPWSRGSLCGKTAIYHELVHAESRLRHPWVRRDGALEPASWDEALDRVAAGLAGLAGEEILALSYAGNMGIVQRRFPERIANALSATATDGAICDATSTLGHELVLGRAVGPNLRRVVEADLLVLWGCDARRTVQHLMPRVKELCERGATVIAIDIRRSDTLRQIEAWGGRGLVVRPGSDAALALGLAELAFQRGCADLPFLRSRCKGAAEFRAEIAGAYPLERVAAITGLEQAEIDELADRLGAARALWIKTGVGWNRRRNGGQGMRAVASLAAVLGAADRLHFESADHFGLDHGVVARPDLRSPGAPAPIRHVELGQELAGDRFRAALVWGHNPAVTVPDSRAVARGLGREGLFLVVHELFLTETARLADVVLPATALPEHTDLFRSYGHRVLQLSRKACDAPHDQRSNVATFAAIGARLGLPRALWEVREEELALDLLDANAARFTGDELARVRAGEPVELAEVARDGCGTPSGRIELASDRAEALGQPRVATWVEDDGCGGTGSFWLVSAPSVATHNSTFAAVERHRRRAGAARCWLNPDDARELGLAAGMRARLTNEQGALTLAVACSADLPRGLVQLDGFPDPSEVPEGFSSNALTSSDLADLADGNVQYSARVDVARA